MGWVRQAWTIAYNTFRTLIGRKFMAIVLGRKFEKQNKKYKAQEEIIIKN